MNNHLVLVAGKSATGKSASLMGLGKPEGVMYLNCEAGKLLPFPSKFIKGGDGTPGFVVVDPLQVYQAFIKAEEMPECHTIVIDSLTFLMDMYESMYVLTSTNTMKSWGDFAQFFKKLMQEYVAKSTKNVIVLAHTNDQLNEGEMILETKVPIKGSLKNNGIESYFSCVIATKKMPISKLKNYESAMLTITPQEQALGFKYVFQTSLTKETVNERLRSSIGMWDTKETYIDNNIQHVINRLHEYYS